MYKYKYKQGDSALGELFTFEGPGMRMYGSEIHLNVHGDDEASRICRMLTFAFEAGKNERSKEFRNLLNIHTTPWGVEINGTK
jgi:hypothetical protein